MATTSKQSSKQSSKQAQSVKSDSEHSDMEEDKHSIFNGDFKKKNSNEAKHFLKHFNALTNEFFDKEGETKMLKFIWGESMEALVDLVKNNDKKEKIKKAKFVPKDLVKPKKAIDIFGEKFSKESKEKDIKFGKDNNYLTSRKAAWDALSKKEHDKYEKQAKELLESYNAELAKQKSDAIKNGDFPADKIKAPQSSYFLYLADIRAKLTEQFKDEPNKNIKITKECGRLWKTLSDKEKEKYETAYRKSKAEYDIKQQDWKTNETERRKKQSGDNSKEPDDVKIESSGKKTASKNKVSDESEKSKESDNNETAEEIEEIEAVEEITKSVKKDNKKDNKKVDKQVDKQVDEDKSKTSKKTKAKAKVESENPYIDEEDEENEVVDEEIEEKKAKLAKSTKSASTKAKAK
jgi:hypothetical protein